MRILVTGGSGFVGMNLIKTLSKTDDVINMDIIPVQYGNENFVKCDITDLKQVSTIFKTELNDVDVIVHLAALSKESASNKQPDVYFKANVTGTFNILNGCLHSNVKNFVFASSYLVYGNSEKVPVDELRPLTPNSVYAATKVCGEAIANSFHHIYGINAVSLRKCVIYGENDPQKRVVNLFIDMVKQGKDITVFGDKTLDFLYINDAVDAYIKAIEYKKSDIFNIGSGKGHSLKEIANMIVDKIKSSSKIIEAPAREGEVYKYIADISKAKRLLNFQPYGNLIQFIENQCA